MVYIMKMKVDGGCRGNGQADAIGAAAVVNILKWGRQKRWSEELPKLPRPTNSRAEISAIILALRKALERYQNLTRNPRLWLTIYSDSDYLVKSMNQYVHKWVRNGWRTAVGGDVKNQDLIKLALTLEDELKKKGTVRFVHIPREQNQDADSLCNAKLDEMAQRRSRVSTVDYSDEWY